MAATLARVDEGRRAALTREFAERCEPFVEAGTLRGKVAMSTMLGHE